MEAIEVLQQMAANHTDEQIATTLNRLGFQTGAGNTWSEHRVYTARHYHHLPAYDPQRSSGFLTLEQAAEHLGLSAHCVRRMIKREELQADQVVPCAPWRIPVAALDIEAVQQAVQRIKAGSHRPRTQMAPDQEALFSTG
jgi:DNA-directed RNA polymerase subunit N (RpoN/RPB10)